MPSARATSGAAAPQSHTWPTPEQRRDQQPQAAAGDTTPSGTHEVMKAALRPASISRARPRGVDAAVAQGSRCAPRPRCAHRVESPARRAANDQVAGAPEDDGGSSRRRRPRRTALRCEPAPMRGRGGDAPAPAAHCCAVFCFVARSSWRSDWRSRRACSSTARSASRPTSPDVCERRRGRLHPDRSRLVGDSPSRGARCPCAEQRALRSPRSARAARRAARPVPRRLVRLR